METVFRVDVIKRGLKCGLSVWAAGGKGNVGQKCSVMNFLIPKKEKQDYLLVVNGKLSFHD